MLLIKEEHLTRHNSLWERACSRRRRISQHPSQMTYRIREQARSHSFRSSRAFVMFLEDKNACAWADCINGVQPEHKSVNAFGQGGFL
ncbi:hypothetical protein EMIT0347P_60016 [Pseudomonas sp. IT-347P]